MITEGQLELEISSTGCVNFASTQNSVPIVSSITIKNKSDKRISDLQLDLFVQPIFCRTKRWVIDRVDAGGEVSLSNLHLEYDLSFFSGLNEMELGELSFTLKHVDIVIIEKPIPIKILARDEWGGVNEMASLLAAFVSPNNPRVASIITGAVWNYQREKKACRISAR